MDEWLNVKVGDTRGNAFLCYVDKDTRQAWLERQNARPAVKAGLAVP